MNKQLKVVNLTKSALNFIAKDGAFITIRSQGEAKVDILRVEQPFEGLSVDSFSPIALKETRISKVKGIPPYEEGTVYIVPTLVYQCCYHYRPDVYVIDEPVKDGSNTRTCKSISRPLLMSVQSDFKKINSILTKINFEDKDDVIDKVFQAKSLTDKYYK